MSETQSKSTARALDRANGFRFVSKKPEIVRTLVVRERTRLPIFVITTTLAAAIVAVGWYFYESAHLKHERRINEERFITILESPPSATPANHSLPTANADPSSPAMPGAQDITPLTVLPASPRPQNSSDAKLRTPPTVRATTAEVDGRPVTR